MEAEVPVGGRGDVDARRFAVLGFTTRNASRRIFMSKGFSLRGRVLLFEERGPSNRGSLEPAVSDHISAVGPVFLCSSREASAVYSSWH